MVKTVDVRCLFEIKQVNQWSKISVYSSLKCTFKLLMLLAERGGNLPKILSLKWLQVEPSQRPVSKTIPGLRRPTDGGATISGGSEHASATTVGKMN